MSNEQPQEKRAPEIPVRHLYFVENLDLQGASQISNLRCYPDPARQPNYWTADFLPAWRMFRITWHRPGTEPEIRYMPVEFVRTWSKFDEKAIAELTKAREGNWR